MVGVFTTATATIMLRTGSGPRWLAIAGYLISAVLLVGTFVFPWTALLFPAWVFVISLDIVRHSIRRDRTHIEAGMGRRPAT